MTNPEIIQCVAAYANGQERTFSGLAVPSLAELKELVAGAGLESVVRQDYKAVAAQICPTDEPEAVVPAVAIETPAIAKEDE